MYWFCTECLEWVFGDTDKCPICLEDSDDYMHYLATGELKTKGKRKPNWFSVKLTKDKNES